MLLCGTLVSTIFHDFDDRLRTGQCPSYNGALCSLRGRCWSYRQYSLPAGGVFLYQRRYVNYWILAFETWRLDLEFGSSNRGFGLRFLECSWATMVLQYCISRSLRREDIDCVSNTYKRRIWYRAVSSIDQGGMWLCLYKTPFRW